MPFGGPVLVDITNTSVFIKFIEYIYIAKQIWATQAYVCMSLVRNLMGFPRRL